MKVLWLTVIAICFSFIGVSQNTSGIIKYERTIYYSKIIESLPYLSQEQKDRNKLMWGNDEGRAHPYELKFTPEQSIYTYGEEEREYNYSWRKDEFLLIKDYANKKIRHQQVMGGQLFVIEDEVPSHKWKIHNEIREVAGHLCFKAETTDTIKKQTVYAWFTNEIPVAGGPEGYGGLPGMILMLEINNGTSIVEATNVDFSVPQIEIPKKIKGKKVDLQDFRGRMEKFFAQSIDGQRNPYWRIRY